MQSLGTQSVATSDLRLSTSRTVKDAGNDDSAQRAVEEHRKEVLQHAADLSHNAADRQHDDDVKALQHTGDASALRMTQLPDNNDGIGVPNDSAQRHFAQQPPPRGGSAAEEKPFPQLAIAKKAGNEAFCATALGRSQVVSDLVL